MKDFIIISLLIFTGFTGISEACDFNGDSVKAFSTSFIKETGSFYNLKTSREDQAKFVLGGCSRSKKKYFQISFGVSHDYIDNSTSISALYDNFVPSACSLRPMPFKSQMSRKEEKNAFLEKLSFLKKCFDIYVTSLAGQPLIFPENQKGCKPELIKPSKVKLNGNLCFFDIIQGDGFLVELKYKDSCKKREFFVENKISTQDFVSHLGFNVVNTADGTGEGIITVGSSIIRMSIDPEARNMRVSDDFGRATPLFPAVWSVPDVHFGKPTLEANGKQRILNLPFVADNRCKKTCIDGICSSPCHYASPVAAEVELFELSSSGDIFEEDDFFGDDDGFKSLLKGLKKKPAFIKSFYNGGIVQANWQGQISGNRIQLGEEIKAGRRYRVKASFRDPKLDYHFLMKNYKSLLGSIPSLRDAQGGVIQGISGASEDVLSSISSMISNLGTVQDDGSGISPLRRAILKFQSLFSYHAWPVYVDKVCDSSLLACKKPTKKDNLVLTMDFTAGSEREFGEIALKNIKITRTSPVLKNYSKSFALEELPIIACFDEENIQEGESNE
ncbi:MAG: hypothetical protein ACJAT2_001197 [Bacteriovoracaceae bacterium]|jgi:hypothetical protein